MLIVVNVEINRRDVIDGTFEAMIRTAQARYLLENRTKKASDICTKAIRLPTGNCAHVLTAARPVDGIRLVVAPRTSRATRVLDNGNRPRRRMTVLDLQLPRFLQMVANHDSRSHMRKKGNYFRIRMQFQFVHTRENELLV